MNNFCAHTFDSPQGVHADSSNNVYVADSSNRRIVKYDSAGNFVGWIGLNGVGNDIWQGSGAVISGTTLNSRATSAAPRNGDLTNLSATVTELALRRSDDWHDCLSGRASRRHDDCINRRCQHRDSQCCRDEHWHRIAHFFGGLFGL